MITVQGIVRGKMIELAETLGMAEGQAVEVQVTLLPTKTVWGEGLQRSAGALSADWNEVDDQILQQIYQDRQQDSRREMTE